MKFGAEFENAGLWYGWDADSGQYWAWSDACDDWVAYVDEEVEVPAAGDEEVEVPAAGDEEVEVPAAGDENVAPVSTEAPEGDIVYYITDEEVYYYKDGLIEYDEGYDAYYYYTNPNDEEEYDWLPDHLSDLGNAIEVPTRSDMVPGNPVPSQTIMRATSVDLETNDKPPELYFDQMTENYVWKGLTIHFKRDGERYYVHDQFRNEDITLPDELVAHIVSGEIAVWNSVATSGITAPANLQPEEEEAEETADSSPIKSVDISPKKAFKPVIPIPSGSLYKIEGTDLNIYNAGCQKLSEEGDHSLWNEELQEHFQLSRWGEFLVGRCRRTFGGLIRGEITVDGIISRLRELTELVKHLNDLQLLLIWTHNCTATDWFQSQEETVRGFCLAVERQVPFLVFVRCLMRGIDQDEGSSAYYIRRYSPKDKIRSPVVEKAQNIIRRFEEHHIKQMGRIIVLVCGGLILDKRLTDSTKDNPWFVLPADEAAEAPTVYFNCNTLQAFTSDDMKKPTSVLKLVGQNRQDGTTSGFHVCKA